MPAQKIQDPISQYPPESMTTYAEHPSLIAIILLGWRWTRRTQPNSASAQESLKSVRILMRPFSIAPTRPRQYGRPAKGNALVGVISLGH